MKVVIMAGGTGTRIASVNSEVPKPMIPLLEKPILEHQIDCLKKQGYTDIILVVGHLGHVIRDYFADGSSFGVTIDYIVEDTPLGSAGALFLLKERLTEDFLLLNGDIVFDIDIASFLRRHREKGGVATLFTHPNNHPYDSGIIIADGEGRVTNWLHKEDERLWYRNRVNAGIHLLSPKIFEDPAGAGIFKELKKTDLDRDVLKPLISTGQVFVYDSPEYVKDMGTPDRYRAVTEDMRSGKVQAKNRSRLQKAVFLDRDGTLNRHDGFLTDIEDFTLIDGVAEAIKAINASGYLAIVITNQPVVARGEVTFAELDTIHQKMETLLGREGAYLDAVYFCPHHPHKGYEGEVPELKIECECRKPKPGMILQAARDFHIDLSASWMVGDSDRDVLAGKNAGCKTVLLSDREENVGQTLTCSSVLDFIRQGLLE